MIVANYLRKTLLEPLKERQRMEGYREGLEIGRAEGIEIGRKIGRAKWLAEEREQGLKLGGDMVDAAWTAWNARRERAAARAESRSTSRPRAWRPRPRWRR